MSRERDRADQLKIDVGTVVPAHGDRKRLRGRTGLVSGEDRGIEFGPGHNLEWSVEIRRISGGIEVSTGFNGTISLVCDRCLELYEHPVEMAVREHAVTVPEEDIAQGDDYADEYVVVDGILDLEPVFRDAISLSMPVRRVCAQSCRGICPVCGADRNRERCGCDTSVVDARLSPLEELKKRLEGGKDSAPPSRQ